MAFWVLSNLKVLLALALSPELLPSCLRSPHVLRDLGQKVIHTGTVPRLDLSFQRKFH